MEIDLARFWSKVDVRGPDECWNWTAGLFDCGYGAFSVSGVNHAASRVSAFINGLVVSLEAPKDRRRDGFVLHKCDNRKCVNPRHLEVGTLQKNNKDAYSRGGNAAKKGEQNHSAKLSEREVKEIRLAYSQGGVSQRKLANEYAISQAQISRVIGASRWKHVIRSGSE